jgi:hypothetical protein
MRSPSPSEVAVQKSPGDNLRAGAEARRSRMAAAMGGAVLPLRPSKPLRGTGRQSLRVAD